MKLVPWICVIAFAMGIAITSPAIAQTNIRYVHPSGSNSNDGDGWGSTAAWQTLAHALMMLDDPDPGFDTI